MTLHESLVRLASANPELRKTLVPLIRQAKGTSFAGTNTTPYAVRMRRVREDWWRDVEAVITEWFSFSKVTVKRGAHQLAVRVEEYGSVPFTITVKGTPAKFKVALYNREREFGPDTNLEKDLAYWIDSVKQSR